MESSQAKNASTVDAPKLPYLLGELPINDGSTAPRGGINPYSPVFDNIGDQFLRFFIDHAHLTPKDKILDIGCGTGRIAKPMQSFLQSKKYIGFDINSRFIEYCKESYHKSFTFDHIDVQHDEYNPTGTIDASTLVFPYDDNYFDFATAIAVFNHMKHDWIVNYISEIARVLRPQGTFFGTFILLNQRSIQSIESRDLHPFKFDVKHDDGWYEYHTRPLWNAAVPEMSVRRSFIANHMMIKEPIRYGEWCGSTAAITGHDCVIAIKGQWSNLGARH